MPTSASNLEMLTEFVVLSDAYGLSVRGQSTVTLNGTQSCYSCDDMGNRTSLGEGPGFARMTTWTPNELPAATIEFKCDGLLRRAEGGGRD